MSPSRTGFVVSALSHAVLVGLGLYLWLKPTTQPADSKEVIVPVSLASFAPSAKPKPIPSPAHEPPSSPPSKPEAATQPEPKPFLEEPPAPPSPVTPEPKPEQKTEPTPEHRSEPKPERKSEPKPEPKPIHHPAPPKKPAPKTLAAPETSRPPSRTPALSPSTNHQPEKRTETAPEQNQAPTSLTAHEQESLTLQYQSALAEAIEREKFYPSLARRLNQEGIIRIGFTVLADGRITNIHLVEPSAATALNQGAIEAIKRVGQFKPIPPALGIQSMDLSIGLIYKLR